MSNKLFQHLINLLFVIFDDKDLACVTSKAQVCHSLLAIRNILYVDQNRTKQ